MLRRFDRYFLREILGPLGLGFLVYTFILLFQFLFRSAEMIIRRGVDAGTVGELLVLSLPHIVVLTVPMALLFGILTAVGRMSSDSELIALRAGGVSLLQLYRAIGLISLLLTLVSMYLMLYVQPWGNTRLQQLQIQIISQSVAKQVEPRIFYAEWEPKVLYVFEKAPDDDRWHGVFLAHNKSPSETEVTVAEWGEVTIDPTGERLALRLTNAVTHELDLNKSDHYYRTTNGVLEILLDDQFSSRRREARAETGKGVRELTLPELRRVARSHEDPMWRNLANVEIHKKFSMPVACLVFGLIALPLGFSNRRGSKASGFALSIAVIMLYALMINNGERAARVGHLPPWLAMWLPNIVLFIPGLFILIRRNRDKSLLLSRFDRWVREDVWSGVLRFTRWRQTKKQRKQEQLAEPSQPSGPRVRLRLPQFRLRFPNLIDRYVLRVFLGVMAMVLASALSLYIISDLSKRLDDILTNKVPAEVVASFYQNLSLQFIYELAPLVLLISTLITFSLLTRSNEVTAAKALGLSLYRLSLPAVIAGLAVALGCVYLQSRLLPEANVEAQRLEDILSGRETNRTYTRGHQWLYGQGGFLFNILHYDEDQQSLQRLQVFEVDDQAGFSIRRRLFAPNAKFDPALAEGEGRWVLNGGWIRTFDDAGNMYTQNFDGEALLDSKEKPEFFASELRPPEQMRFGELRQYIDELKASGQDVPELEVHLHNKFAFPFVSLVMVLVGLPFAFRIGRQGALYGIGLSIVLGMVFFAILALFTALGETGVLPPPVAVWSPGALFALTSLYLFLGVRT